MKDKNKDSTSSGLICGADVGTGTLLFAKMVNDKIEVNQIRNMFIKIDDSDISASEMANSKLDYITQLDDEGKVDFHCVIGEDALKMGNVFNKKVHRPMAKGMISPDEIYAVPIISAMFKSIIEEEVKGGRIVFSIPSQPIDVEEGEITPVHFHSEIFKNIFKDIGFDKAIPLNEGQSIIFSNCSEENFTGIGISWGSGQVNVSLTYKGSPILQFSTSRSGDWIDNYAASSSGFIPNKITTIKEKDDFSIKTPYLPSTNKKERIPRQALSFAFNQLIDYTIDIIKEEFEKNVDNFDFDDVEFPIVIGGGTSLVKDFVDIFREKFNEVKNFPIKVSEIRHAKNPIEAVSIGCLVYSRWLQDKEEK